MDIRVMSIDDYDDLYALWLSCKGMGLNDVDDSREGIERYLRRNPATSFVAVEDGQMVEKLNALLHEYGEFIIGRMGIPYRKRNISIISIALDAPQNTISAMAGKIGCLNGISVKTAYSSIISEV